MALRTSSKSSVINFLFPCVSFRWWSSIPLVVRYVFRVRVHNKVIKRVILCQVAKSNVHFVSRMYTSYHDSIKQSYHDTNVFYYWGLYDTSIVISYKAKSSAGFEHR